MYAVIIASHGELAKGIKSVLDFVAGDFDNLEVVGYKEDENYEDLDKKLIEKYDILKEKGYKSFIFVTDLVGGTPFTRCVMNFNKYDNVRVIGGMNFATVYSALICEENNIEEDIKSIINDGKNAIDYYKMVRREDDIDEEDGI